LQATKTKHAVYKSEMWKRKRLNFCRSGSSLKKEAGSGSKLGSDNFIRSWKRKQKYSTASTSL